MLFGQVAGLPLLLGTPDGWPLILAGVVVPAAVQLIFFQPLLVESPRWLLLHGRPESARAAPRCAAAMSTILSLWRSCAMGDIGLVDSTAGGTAKGFDPALWSR